MITRPDGRPYRPLKPGLRARAWENEDESGVIVFGTLDPVGPASALAHEACAGWYGDGDSFHIARPVPGWWRDGYGVNGRTWIDDEVLGAPGVMFTWAYTMPVAPLDVHQLRAGESAGAE